MTAEKQKKWTVMKHKHKLIGCVLLVSVLFLCSKVYAQTITGYVIDTGSRLPLEGAIVMVVTDEGNLFFEVRHDGYYVFDLPAGVYTLSCNMQGYETNVVEQVRLGPGDTRFIDFEMVTSARAAEGSDPQYDPDGRPAPVRQEEAQQIRDAAKVRAASSGAATLKNPAIGLGAGYQAGEIGGLGASIDISLSRLFGINPSSPASLLFLGFSAGYQDASYQSLMFNDKEMRYAFTFFRATAGLSKVMTAGSFLFTPGMAFGMEQATPGMTNVHEMIDNDHIRVFSLQPSLSLGYTVASWLVLDITATYYSMLKESTNKENRILAAWHADSDSWVPWSYSSDFFPGREGLGVMVGLKVYF
jgi:hypothetical protein